MPWTMVRAALAVALALATPVMAQAPTRDDLTRLAPAPAAPSRLEVVGGVDDAPCPLADAAYAGETIVVRSVVFDHLTGLDPDVLGPAYAGLTGQAVPLATACTIRDRAAAILRTRGFLAGVSIPAQPTGDGVLHLDIVLGRIVRIETHGDLGHSAGLIRAYLDRLTRMPVFDHRAAERTLLLARDLPGFDIRLTLRSAGTVPGALIGDVSVTRRPITISAGIQNDGSHALGHWGASAAVQANDLFGAGDRLTAGLFNTVQPREQTVALVGYDAHVGHDGLTLGGRLTYAHTRPDVGAGDPFRSRTLIGTIEARYPVRRSEALSLTLVGGADLVNQRLNAFTIPLTRDRLRLIHLRGEIDLIDRDSIAGGGGYDSAWPRLHLSGAIELRQGVGVLGAGQRCGSSFAAVDCASLLASSRLDGSATGTSLRLDGQLEFRPIPAIDFVLAPRVQKGFGPLLSFEQFAGGGYTIGRGYDPATIVGDSGAGASAEIRFGRGTIRPYAFVDAARVWSRGLVTLEERQGLISAGGGVRATRGLVAIDAALAAPLRRAGVDTRRGKPRALLTLTVGGR